MSKWVLTTTMISSRGGRARAGLGCSSEADAAAGTTRVSEVTVSGRVPGQRWKEAVRKRMPISCLFMVLSFVLRLWQTGPSWKRPD